MSTNNSLEERLAAVEMAITELKQQMADSQSTNWLQQITGSFKDEPAFEAVLAYGRDIRQFDSRLTIEAASLFAKDRPYIYPKNNL